MKEANGISNDEEDSNHSQQSLDSVGGAKPAHLKEKQEIKEDPNPKVQKELENGINGKHNGELLEKDDEVKFYLFLHFQMEKD